MKPDIQEILDRHGIIVRRSGRISCPSPAHEDSNPSCAVNEDYVYCFACGFNADAAGLEAALTGTRVDDVLRSWSKDDPLPPLPKAASQKEMRDDIWLTWVVWSQSVLAAVWEGMAKWGAEDWQFDAAQREVNFIMDRVTLASHPGKLDEPIAPVKLRKLVKEAEKDLAWWMDRWMEEA